MQKTGASLLLHPIFIASLSVLLINDHYWKYEYQNWLTGKLSDVAGVIVLPVFLMVFLPGQKKKVLLFTALFFLWWKSPLSESAIRFFNQRLHWPVQRVVDYSDWLALLVLPIAARLSPRSLRLQRITVLCTQWATGVVTVISLCATSMPYRQLFMAHPDVDHIFFHEAFTQKRKAADILHSLQRKGIIYRIDSVMYYPVLNQRDLYYRRQAAQKADSVWQRASQAADSMLYVKRAGAPYYLISDYKTNGPMGEVALRNVRFTLSENKKGTKTSILIETFESAGWRGYLDNKTRNEYKEVFKTLFFEN